jgi:hypothetical protein
MARRKRSNSDQPIGVGLTAKQAKRKKPLSSEYLVDIEPLTDNQKRLFEFCHSCIGAKAKVVCVCAWGLVLVKIYTTPYLCL